jgi:hypothetical protein
MTRYDCDKHVRHYLFIGFFLDAALQKCFVAGRFSTADAKNGQGANRKLLVYCLDIYYQGAICWNCCISSSLACVVVEERMGI